MKAKNGIIYNAIKKRTLTLIIVAVIFILGIMSYMGIPKQEYPVVQMPMAIITTVYPGASPNDVEQLVTSKVEDEAKEVKGFDYCTSQSLNGVSVVTVTFKTELEDEELTKSLNDLRNKVKDLKDNELPSGVVSLNYNTDILETAGLIVSLTGDEDISMNELNERAESLKGKLGSVNGVNKIEVSGNPDEEIYIEVDEEKLRNTGLSLNNLTDMIAAQNTTIPIGTIDFAQNKFTVNSSGNFESIDDIKDIIVQGSQGGVIVKLKDIAEVTKSINEDSKSYIYNGKSAVLVNLYFDDSVNVLDVKPDIDNILKTYIDSTPENIHVDKIIYLADNVQESINNFLLNLVESVAIVLIIVMLGMSFINGAIVSIVIPLAIFMTFIAMKMLNIDVQFISLASLIIALGMLVDNAIVVSDSIQVRYDNGEDKISACVNGPKEVALSVLASTMTTVVIFSIFFMLPGHLGNFAFSLPAIVISALVASYAISMLVTPVLCYMLIKKSKPKKQRKMYVQEFFTKLLHKGLEHKAVTIIIAIAAVIVGILVMMNLNSQLIPNSGKDIIDISITTTKPNDVRETKQVMDKVNEFIAELPENKYYLSSSAGRVPKYDFSSSPSTDSINCGSVFLKIDLKQGGRFKNNTDFIEELQREFDSKIPGCKIVVKELGIMPSSTEPIQLRVTGDDFDKLNEVAGKIEDKMNETQGIKDIYCEVQSKSYDYYLKMNDELLNTYGITKAEVQSELQIAMMGRTASIYRENSKEYPIVLKSAVTSIDDLKNMPIKSNATGNIYKLSQICDIQLKEDYSSINRYDGKRSVLITASPMTGYSDIDVQSKLANEINNMNIDSDITIVHEGNRKEFLQVTGTLGAGAGIGVVAILLILYIQFNSMKQTFVVLLSMPFALVGAAIGLKIFGQDLSMFALLGIISLIGVVVNNAIVLVDYINEAKKQGISVDEACKNAVERRFKPIVLSTSTTVLGLIPLAIGDNILFVGLSIAFMSGLTISLLFTLVVIPVAYSILEGKQK